MRLYGIQKDGARYVGVVDTRTTEGARYGTRSSSIERTGDSWPVSRQGRKDAEAWSLNMNVTMNRRSA